MWYKDFPSFQMVIFEWRTQWKRPSSFAAAAIQVATVSFLCYLSSPIVTPKIWNSLFWLSAVFSTFISAGRSFLQVSQGRWLLLNQLGSPNAILLGKIFYNWALVALLSLLTLALFSLFLGNPVEHHLWHLGFVVFTAFGISSIFTMMSAIASKTSESAFLLPVLSLPVIFPVILVGIKGSLKCLNPVLVSSAKIDFLVLISLNALILALCFILFKVLWKD